MSIKLRSGSQWKNVNKAYLRSGGAWKTITKAYIRSGGVWKRIFGSLATPNEPSIAQTVTLVRSSSTMPATLTGTNYRWTNATALTYKFQYYNGSQWLDANGNNATGTITNPSAGSSNTKTYTPIIGDFPSSSSTSTAEFRFVVTATNTDVSPSLQTVSTSSTVSVQNVISVNPIIPTITMLEPSNVSQTEGTINWTSTNQISWSSTGTFSGSGTNETSVSKTGLTAGIRYTGTVTVTSSTGNTASADYDITASPAVNPPQIIQGFNPVLTVSANNTMSVTSGAWTNSPEYYRYKWYRLDPQPTTIVRNVFLEDTTDSYSGTYLREYQVGVLASNTGGTSSEAFSNIIVLEPPVITYTITWNANGGTVSPTSNTVNEGISVTAPTPTRSGYTFSQWRYPDIGTAIYIYNAGDVFTPEESFTLYATWTANPSCTAGYLPYGDWEYKDSNGNDTSWSDCVNNSQSRGKRQARYYQNADCSTSGPYYNYGTDTQACTVTCTEGCGSYGDIVYGTYTDCVNCSKSRTRSQTRTCVNTDCTTYPDTLNLTDQTTSCSCPTFEGDWSPYGAYGPYGPCGVVGCLAIKIRTRSSTRIVQDACCNITTQTRTQDQSTYCTVTKYKCSNFDVTNSNSVNYFDCFTVGACTAPQDPACVREACQFS